MRLPSPSWLWAGPFGVAALALCLAACRPANREPPRVAQARAAHGKAVRELCRGAGISYPPREIFLRACKREAVLECWVRNDPGEPFHFLRAFAVTASSGLPGPKRREGDRQVPEGLYEVDSFNPESNFHLSLRVNYPNASDRILSDHEHPGQDIYLHGGAQSVGCLPIGDEAIELLYLLAFDTAAAGGPIHLHLFPARMDAPDWAAWSGAFPEHAAFWATLRPIYLQFEQTHRLPWVQIAPDGHYALQPEGPL